DPLVPRNLRFEVPERIGADGSIVRELDIAALEEIARAVELAQVRAIAICFLNACSNSAHEKQAERFFHSRLPGVLVTASTSLLPQVGEYERTSTTVINAYLRPVVNGYMEALEQRLRTLGVPAPLMIMQSSGGIAPGALVAETPITIIESGPSSGVAGERGMGRGCRLRGQ